MPSITPHTVAELIYWPYANLAMAQDGINRGLPTYDKTSFIIRMRLFKGLFSGKLQISSLFKDERWKMENGARCVIGLAADIKILQGKKLLDYIKKYDKKRIQKL